MKELGIGEGLANRLFDGLVEVDLGGHIEFWNAAAERITGYAAASVVGRHFQHQPAKHISESGSTLQETLVPVLATLQDGRPREGLVYLDHADGYRLTVMVHTALFLDKHGKATGAFEVFTDNKALVAAYRSSLRTEETIFFDPLTGIGNRPHIENKVRMAFENAGQGDRHFGILFIDIDHFKDFNDSHGHLTGDKILRMAANTLRQNLRGSDSCGRWGGEEFLVLVHNVDPAGLQKVAEKLRHSVSGAKLQEKNLELAITISIGASLARPDDSYQTLMERADLLMYESKRLGRDRVTTDCIPPLPPRQN